ncbi:MAG: MotA/TolQ/ExbB proton channel family protein [Myxococcota bacterium]|nr:MotA/TolQ/ExbB proton channel family protein [Myxococcota bacterium]
MRTRRFSLVWGCLIALIGAPAHAAETQPATVDELLEKVRRGWERDTVDALARERVFVDAKQNRQALVDEARALKAREEQRSKALEQTFQEHEKAMAELEESLHLAMGNMGELFGVIRQVAGDTRSQLESSLVAAQYPGRAATLDSLVESRSTPSVEALNALWFALQQEMTESGKVVTFDTQVTDPSGESRTRSVTRVGVFNAVSEGKYLRWLSEVGRLTELARQPGARYLSTAEDLQRADEEMVRFGLDPSRGSILSLLVQTPNLRERVQLGGIIGYMILFLGALTLLGALFRVLYLSRVKLKVRAQKSNSTPLEDNPLGRVMRVFSDNPGVSTETLNFKLDEAILREQANLDRFLWAIKVVSVVAPLMGLLGTVTGMIRTFQAITLFGTGDPKLMAGGISEALVTTMLGLVVAIPLVLIHSWLRTMSRRLMDVLGEQSAGIVARPAEQSTNA